MEQKLKDKIEIAARELAEKQNRFYASVKEFNDHFITDDIRTMINAIYDAGLSYTYTFGEYIFWISQFGDLRIKQHNNVVLTMFSSCNVLKNEKVYRCNKYRYTNEAISIIKTSTERYLKEVEYFKLLQDVAEDIIRDITTKYRQVVETQADSLDNILDMLDCKEEPTKHIKVTVEWV